MGGGIKGQRCANLTYSFFAHILHIMFLIHDPSEYLFRNNLVDNSYFKWNGYLESPWHEPVHALLVFSGIFVVFVIVSPPCINQTYRGNHHAPSERPHGSPHCVRSLHERLIVRGHGDYIVSIRINGKGIGKNLLWHHVLIVHVQAWHINGAYVCSPCNIQALNTTIHKRSHCSEGTEDCVISTASIVDDL